MSCDAFRILQKDYLALPAYKPGNNSDGDNWVIPRLVSICLGTRENVWIIPGVQRRGQIRLRFSFRQGHCDVVADDLGLWARYDGRFDFVRYHPCRYGGGTHSGFN